MTLPPPKPTPEDVRAAVGKTILDVIEPNLNVLFCGINPGLYTAAIGYHFGRPGNRFWPALRDSGFTDRLLKPWEQDELLKRGIGITNLVPRATASAAELTLSEFREGAARLEEKVRKYSPKWLAFVGIEAYRKAFAKPKAVVGEQQERIGGARVWVLPSTSGLNAHHNPRDIGPLFRDLRIASFDRE